MLKSKRSCTVSGTEGPRRAIADLDGIARYVSAESVGGADRVMSDIEAALRMLSEHPASGRLQDLTKVRKLVTIRFRYLVYYRLKPGELEILHIRRPARARLYRDS